MARREFTRAVYAQIVHRATNSGGRIVCEGCGLVLGKKPWAVDHTTADGLQIDKSRKLTAADGKLLGKACCHDPKTFGEDIPAIAKAKRREAKNTGITRPAGLLQSAPFAKTDKAAARAEKAAGKAMLAPKPMFTAKAMLWQPVGGEVDQ